MEKHRIFSLGYIGALIFFLFPSVSLAAVTLQSKPQYGGEYRAPLVTEPVTLDPANYTDIYSMNVAANLFDGLVRFNRDLKVVPAIASLWKISRDHRTYTFLLRKGVRFHNGREVTADDFVYSFSRILDPATRSPVASLFLNIKGAKAYHEGKSPRISGLSAPRKGMLKVELEKPFAPFLSILAMVNAKVVPKEAIGPEFSKHPIGTGPFRFRTWQPGKEIVLQANPHYFDGQPLLSTVRFRIYPNIEFEQIFADFKQGLLEHAIVPSDQYDQILANPDNTQSYTLISKPGLNVVYVGMNTTLPPFDDLRVRQAINYAVDTKTIVTDIAKRGSTPANGILPPGIAGFNPNVPGYTYEPERARELLSAAGYPEGRGFPPIELWTVAKSENVQKQLQAYQRYLAAVGIEVKIRVAENWKGFVKAISDKRAGMFYAAWYADYPDPDNFFYPLAHSKSRTNRMRFSDPRVDRLLEQGRSEMDYLKRAALYQNVEQLVMEGAPIISQHTNSSSYLFQPWVQGMEMSRLGDVYLPFRAIWLDQQQQQLSGAQKGGISRWADVADTQ